MRQFFKKHASHPLVHNVLALYAVQIAGYILPLVTFPYLARVLRPQLFGLLLFSQSFALWSSLLIEYGFNFSATRDIARSRDDKKRVNEVAAGVLGAKLLLLSVVLAIVSASGGTVEMFREHSIYLALAVPQTIALGFSPFWYFQGTEKMVWAIAVEFVARLLSTTLIFVFVHQPSDAWRALAIQASGACLCTFVQTGMMYRTVVFARPTWRGSKEALASGFQVFLFRSTNSILMSGNSFILGLFSTTMNVGLYGGAERISKALQGLSGPITQAAYPWITNVFSKSKERAARLSAVLLALSVAMGLILGGVIASLSRTIIRILLGAGYEGSIPVLQIFSLLLPLMAANTGLIMHWMLPRGLEKIVNIAVGAGIMVNFALAAVLAPKYGQVGMAWAVVVAQLSVLFSLIVPLVFRPMLSERIPSFSSNAPKPETACD